MSIATGNPFVRVYSPLVATVLRRTASFYILEFVVAAFSHRRRTAANI
jgi:hypothetical protein